MLSEPFLLLKLSHWAEPFNLQGVGVRLGKVVNLDICIHCGVVRLLIGRAWISLTVYLNYTPCDTPVNVFTPKPVDNCKKALFRKAFLEVAEQILALDKVASKWWLAFYLGFQNVLPSFVL